MPACHAWKPCDMCDCRHFESATFAHLFTKITRAHVWNASCIRCPLCDFLAVCQRTCFACLARKRAILSIYVVRYLVIKRFAIVDERFPIEYLNETILHLRSIGAWFPIKHDLASYPLWMRAGQCADHKCSGFEIFCGLKGCALHFGVPRGNVLKSHCLHYMQSHAKFIILFVGI